MAKKAHSARRSPTRQELRDLSFEIHFMEGVIKRDPTFAEALQVLGDDYTKCGRYNDGLRIDERLRVLRPDDSLVHYNLACSYSLTLQLDRAIEALEASIELGYRDFNWLAHDPDLKNLRRHANYKKIRAKIRELRTATSRRSSV